MTTQTKNRGFTLVELLIVIVIIAILTVISLVAYNGIQNQARTTTAESTAKSVSDKVQIYYTSKGSYPTALSDLTSAAVKEAYNIDTNAVKIVTTSMTGKPDEPNTVFYKKCTSEGATIQYWNFSNNSEGIRKLGDTSNCS